MQLQVKHPYMQGQNPSDVKLYRRKFAGIVFVETSSYFFIPALETPIIPLHLSCWSGAAEYGAISFFTIAGLEFSSCASSVADSLSKDSTNQ